MIKNKIYKNYNNENNKIVNLVIMLCFLSIQLMSLDTVSLMSVPFMFLMISLLVLNLFLKHEKIVLIIVHKWFILSFCIVIISALISINIMISLQYAAYYILYVLIFVLLSFDNKWHYICLMTQIIFSLVHVTVTVFSYFFPNIYYALVLPLYSDTNKNLIIYWMKNNNYPGIAGQIGTNSFFISLGIAIIIAYLFSNMTKKRVLLIIILLILTYALFLTGKRGMLIGNVIAIMFTWYYGPLSCKKTRLYKMFKALVSSLALLYLLSGIIPVLERTIARLLNIGGGADFSSGRIEMYKDAWQLFNKKYFTGYGINSYTTLNIEGFNTSLGSHNDLLQILAEIGIIGTVILVIPIVWIFVKTIKLTRIIFKDSVKELNKYRPFLLASLYIQVLMLVYSMIGNPFHYYNMLLIYMIFSAIPISILLDIRREKKKVLSV
ncbi:MAG: O-antigen ligase family protein [Mobilitalea sp.]